jgi:hypothetical protein
MEGKGEWGRERGGGEIVRDGLNTETERERVEGEYSLLRL